MSSNSSIEVPDRFLFMKVGNHAHESWDDILARKRREFEDAGKIFWGYGGAACHPVKQVQPFARLSIKQQGRIYLVMDPIESNADQDLAEAVEYSVDGIDWSPMPEGIQVTGSRFALVLDEIKEGDLDLSLGDYEVGIGPSRGKVADDYLRGRTDKGCLMKRIQPAPLAEEHRRVQKHAFIAELQEPYAVFLR